MKNASQVQYNQQLATCHIHNQNKQGAACDWSDHQNHQSFGEIC